MSVQTPKRVRTHSTSPKDPYQTVLTTDMEGERESASNQNNLLLAAIEKMLDEKLETKIQAAVTKSITTEFDTRLKNIPSKQDIDDLRTTMDLQKTENEEMRKNLMNLEGQFERLDKKDRANKLIFSNIVCSNSGAVAAIYHVCNEALKIDPQLISVKNAFVVKQLEGGKTKILVEFAERNMISLIFKHVKNLNGRNISIGRDLTTEEQKTRKMLIDLKKVLLEINTQMKIFVSDISIKVGSNKFTVKNGKLESRNTGMDVNKFFIDNYNLNMDEYLKKKN